jgi:DNA-binding transcriptional ArsR family regulator
MTMKTPQMHVITDPRTMWVLAAPARLEILDAACVMGECSAGDIAAMTGRSRTSLYPHIEHLLGAGLLIDAGIRTTGKRPEQFYRPVARQINFRHNSQDSENVAFHAAYGIAVCRLLARLYRQATHHPDIVPRGPQRDTHSGAQTAWVNDDTLAEINTHINRIWELCRNSEPGEGKRLLQIGVVTAPIRRNGDTEPS